MPIETFCPHCRSPYRLADLTDGRRVRCTKCKGVFTVAAAEEVEPLPPGVETDIATEPGARPRRAAPAERKGQPAVARKKAEDKQSSGALPVLLIVGGVALALVLFVACGGGFFFFLFFEPGKPAAPVAVGPPVFNPNPPAFNNPPVPPPVPQGLNPPGRVPNPQPPAGVDVRPGQPPPGFEANPGMKPPGQQPPVAPPAGGPMGPGFVLPPGVRLPPGVQLPPGAQFPGMEPAPQKPANFGPSRPAAPVVYQPHVPADREEVPLSGTVAESCVGGGGRYLMFRLDGKRKLAVFDVQRGEVAKEVPLLEEFAFFAAGAERLVVLYPNLKVIHFWSLAKLERERSAPMPGGLDGSAIRQVCMGSSSRGPLFLLLNERIAPGGSRIRTQTMAPASLEMVELPWKMYPENLRVSADGGVLLGWGGGWAGVGMARLREGRQVSAELTRDWGDGPFALPSADGRFVFSPPGIADSSLKPAKVPELADCYLLPAVEPGYFLALHGVEPLRRRQQGLQLPAVDEVSVYSEDRRRLFRLRDCEELKQGSKLHWEKRVFYYPNAGLLVTLSPACDRIVLRKADLITGLRKSGEDYLVVLSRPPAAKAGRPFDYRLDVRSNKGGVKVTLENGPDGLKVSPDGRVTWAVPPTYSEPQAEVLVTIRDAGGQESAHLFQIAVEP